MSYLLEIFGQSLPDSLWPVFRETLKGTSQKQTAGKQAFGSAQDSSARDTQRHTPVCTTGSATPTRSTARTERIEQHVLAGISALQNSSGGQAKLHFDRAMVLNDGNPAAKTGMACAVDMLGQPARAKELLELTYGPATEDPRALFALGLLEERCNRPQQARELYQRSIYFQPNQRGSRNRLMAMALANRDYEAATQQAETLAAQYPLELPAWTRLGGLHLLNDDPIRAAKAFEQALRLLADNWQTESAVGSPNYQHDNWQDAVTEIEQALAQEDGRGADLYVRLGDVYARQGIVAEALKAYHEALRVNPYYLEATTKVASCHSRRGEKQEAATWLGRAVQINETLLMAYAGLGLAQAYMGKDKESHETLDLARGIATNGPVLMAEIARLHTAEWLDGQEELEDTDTVEGRALARAILLRRSIQTHLAWLTQHEDDASAWLRLGMLLEADKQMDDACQAYDKAAETYAGCTAALVRLGLLGNSQDSEASGRLRQAFWPDKIDLDTHYELSILFSQAQRFEMTSEKFAESLPSGQNDCFWRNITQGLEQMCMLNMPRNIWQSLSEISRADMLEAPADTR